MQIIATLRAYAMITILQKCYGMQAEFNHIKSSPDSKNMKLVCILGKQIPLQELGNHLQEALKIGSLRANAITSKNHSSMSEIISSDNSVKCFFESSSKSRVVDQPQKKSRIPRELAGEGVQQSPYMFLSQYQMAVTGVGKKIHKVKLEHLALMMAQTEGTHQVEVGNCPPGYRINQDKCFPCFPGSYTSGQGTECFLCPKDFYNSKEGADSCWPCPSGKITVSEGADSEDDCIDPNNSGVFSSGLAMKWLILGILLILFLAFSWILIYILLIRLLRLRKSKRSLIDDSALVKSSKSRIQTKIGRNSKESVYERSSRKCSEKHVNQDQPKTRHLKFDVDIKGSATLTEKRSSLIEIKDGSTNEGGKKESSIKPIHKSRSAKSMSKLPHTIKVSESEILLFAADCSKDKLLAQSHSDPHNSIQDTAIKQEFLNDETLRELSNKEKVKNNRDGEQGVLKSQTEIPDLESSVTLKKSFGNNDEVKPGRDSMLPHKNNVVSNVLQRNRSGSILKNETNFKTYPKGNEFPNQPTDNDKHLIASPDNVFKDDDPLLNPSNKSISSLGVFKVSETSSNPSNSRITSTDSSNDSMISKNSSKGNTISKNYSKDNMISTKSLKDSMLSNNFSEDSATSNDFSKDTVISNDFTRRNEITQSAFKKDDLSIEYSNPKNSGLSIGNEKQLSIVKSEIQVQQQPHDFHRPQIYSLCSNESVQPFNNSILWTIHPGLLPGNFSSLSHPKKSRGIPGNGDVRVTIGPERTEAGNVEIKTKFTLGYHPVSPVGSYSVTEPTSCLEHSLTESPRCHVEVVLLHLPE